MSVLISWNLRFAKVFHAFSWKQYKIPSGDIIWSPMYPTLVTASSIIHNESTRTEWNLKPAEMCKRSSLKTWRVFSNALISFFSIVSSPHAVGNVNEPLLPSLNTPPNLGARSVSDVCGRTSTMGSTQSRLLDMKMTFTHSIRFETSRARDKLTCRGL